MYSRSTAKQKHPAPPTSELRRKITDITSPLQITNPTQSTKHTKMPPNPPILLLKTKSTPQDGYADFFTANNYTPTFIPVLEHRFHAANLARVRGLFASGAFDPATADKDTDHVDSGGSIAEHGEGRRKYGGMIFTSQRAVEAFVKMIEEEGRMSTNSSHQYRLRALYKIQSKKRNKLT